MYVERERDRCDCLDWSFSDNESSDNDETTWVGEVARCERDFFRNGTIESDDEEDEEDKSFDVRWDFE